jgi:hypothetical protein
MKLTQEEVDKIRLIAKALGYAAAGRMIGVTEAILKESCDRCWDGTSRNVLTIRAFLGRTKARGNPEHNSWALTIEELVEVRKLVYRTNYTIAARLIGLDEEVLRKTEIRGTASRKTVEHIRALCKARDDANKRMV